jgi:hypothetical protein
MRTLPDRLVTSALGQWNSSAREFATAALGMPTR